MSDPDYARAGRVGIATPQANPTVEDEFRILLPPDMGFNVVRLRGCQDSRQRLLDYVDNLTASLETFDVLKPAALGFACTGSSYLVGADREAGMFDDIASRVGYPIVTATGAIRWALEKFNARRIALAGPYPDWLLDAARLYWTARGIEVLTIGKIETGSADTRAIYGLSSANADAALKTLDCTGADAVVLSGTGLPTLQTLANVAGGRPVIASNFALAARLVDLVGTPGSVSDRLEIAGWRERLALTLR